MIYEIPLITNADFWHNSVEEFEIQNNCDVTYWYNEFINWLRDVFHCEYWERETQFGGPCFIFRNEKDYMFFLMRFK